MGTITLGKLLATKPFCSIDCVIFHLAAFLICWWPYAIIFMIGDFTLLWNVVTLAYLNSLINPVLYILINRDVRICIRAILTCKANSELTRAPSVN